MSSRHRGAASLRLQVCGAKVRISSDKRRLRGSPLDFLEHSVLDELRQTLALAQHGLGSGTSFGLDADRGEGGSAHGEPIV